MEITKAGIAKNITNLVGVHLLKNNYYYLEVDELDPLVPQIPAEFANDEVIIKNQRKCRKDESNCCRPEVYRFRNGNS